MERLPKGASVKEPQYGGTLTIATPLSPVSWDINEWIWTIGNDTGFYMEHLLMGDLQKGPRGTNQYCLSRWRLDTSRGLERRAFAKLGSEEKSSAAYLSSTQRCYVAGKARGHEGQGIGG